jgi:hypothetical protein
VRAAKQTANLLEMRFLTGLTVLYVKDGALDPAFLGLSESQLQTFRASTAAWWVVLLCGAGQASYLLASSQVQKATRTHRWSSSGKTAEWKLHGGEGRYARFRRAGCAQQR